jgi:hypothetical protein
MESLREVEFIWALFFITPRSWSALLITKSSNVLLLYFNLTPSTVKNKTNTNRGLVASGAVRYALTWASEV